MQKIVLDTNVLVSALIQRSYPFLILQEVLGNKNIDICVSDELFREYTEVLGRSKFAKFQDFAAKARQLLLDINSYASLYSPNIKLNLISDKDDNKLLELCDVSEADFLITGNHTDFTFTGYKKTRILTPKEYWEEVLLQK